MKTKNRLYAAGRRSYITSHVFDNGHTGEVKHLWVFTISTLGLAYNEFGYYQHPPITSSLLCIHLLGRSVIPSPTTRSQR